MKKLILLLCFSLITSIGYAQTIVPGIPAKTQAGLLVTDTLRVVGNTVIQGNLTVSGSSSISPSTAADSLRANLQFFLGGPSLKKILIGTFTHDWANVTAGTTLDETQTLTGVTVADAWIILVGPQGADLSAGLMLETGARVLADNTIKMRMANKCASDVDNASQSFWYFAVKP